jgi:hypothetical protein
MGYITIRPVTAVKAASVAALPEGKFLPGLSDRLAKTTRSKTGLVTVAPGFSFGANLTAGGTAWGTFAVSASSSMTADECERLNRLTRGTKFPKFETNWRTGTVCANLPGKRHPLPISITAELDTSGIVIPGTLAWLPVTVAPSPSVVVSSPSPSVTVAELTPAAVAAIVVPPTVASVGMATARAALSPQPTPPVSGEPGTARAALTGHVAKAATKGRRTVSPVKAPTEPSPLKAARTEPVGDPTGVFTWPTKGSGIITPRGTDRKLDIIWKMHNAGKRQVISLIGPAGVGKTSLAYDLAARHGVPIAKIDGAGAVTFADWVGSTGATERNGATVTAYRPSGFIQACRADGPMAGIPRIILLDEVNRSESSAANNALIPVLDHTGSLYVADYGRSIPLDPAVMYVMTANMGGSYTGTVSLDQALIDRVTHWVDMVYPTPVAESKLVQDRTGLNETDANSLVAAANQIRQMAGRGEIVEGIGPRRVLMAADKMVAGFTGREAGHDTWSLAYSNEGGGTSERNNVKSAIDAHFKA